MPSSRVGLIGRDGVLARIAGHLAEAARGRGTFVLLTGEPGIGKTRVAAAVVERAHEQGFRSAWGSCRETEGAPPYWPWTQVFRAYAIDDGGRSDDAMSPLLGRTAAAGRETDRFRIFDAAARALASHSRTGPMLIVLDDLHRADEASLQLLRFLAATLPSLPVVVVGASRDSEAGPAHPLTRLVGQLAGDACLDVVELDRLTSAESQLLLRQQAGITDPALAGLLHARTDGNPFFLVELSRLGPAPGDEVPATVEAAIGARLSLLAGPTRSLLELAAVLGRDIDSTLLAETSGLTARDVAVRLRPAVEQRLVASHPAAPGDYRFVHLLVQQVLYAGLSEPDRIDHHDRLADVLVRRVVDRPGCAEAFAFHAGQALTVPGGRDRAFTAARLAARSAAERLADETATRWYGRALALAPPDPDQQITLMLDLGSAAGRAGQAEQARSAFDRAWTTAMARGDTPRAAEAALGLGKVVVSSGTIDAGLVNKLESTLDRLHPGEPGPRAQVTARLATELYWGELDRARPLADAAVALARSAHDDRTLAAALVAQQFVLRGPDHLADRLHVGAELLAIARRLRDEQLELHSHLALISDRFQADPAAADAQLHALVDLADRTHRPIATWYTLVFQALRAVMSGREERAETLIGEAEALGARIGAQPAPSYAMIQRFFLYRSLGRAAQHEWAVRREIGRQPAMIAFRSVLALLLADADRPAEATALLDELAADRCGALPRDMLWLPAVGNLAQAAAVLDRPEHAATLYELLLPHRGQVAAGVAVWCGAVDQFLGRTATVLGRWDDAEEHFRSALRLHETWGAVPFIAATLDGHGAMLRRRGAPGDRSRAVRLTNEASQLRNRDGVQTTTSLSPRETNVLQLIAQGASNKQIAHTLQLSVHTVERHIANLYRKIGVSNRAEATVHHLRTGMPDSTTAARAEPV